MKKALFVATIASFIDGFENNDTKILQDMGYKIEAAISLTLGISEKTVQSLAYKQITTYHIDFARSPFSKQTFLAYKQLEKLINENNYDLIHCHTPVAGILTRIAARNARKKGTTVIYTAHGFHFYKGASILNWLLYYPVEKICSYFTDVLITINKEDFEFAKRKMKAQKVHYISGVGLDTTKFNDIAIDKTEKRKKFGLSDESIVLLSVGELNKNKNHQVIIKALGKLKNDNIHYLIAGQGDWNDKLLSIAKENGVSNNVHLLGFRTDVYEFCKMSDIFCFPSLREGLSVALMESICSGLPCVVSNIRGNIDLIEDSKSGYLINPNDIDGFVRAIQKLANSPEDMKKFGEFSKESVSKYDIKNVGKIMREIYGNTLND